MLTQADTDRALRVVCPLIFCSALIGENCISRTNPRFVVAPHQHRLIKAGVINPPPAPVPASEEPTA